MHLARREKQFFVGVCAVAFALGTFAGYIVLMDELGHQFHGGVLDEDASTVMWHNAWTTAIAFVQVASLTAVVIGVVPIGLRRFFSKGGA
jgi:hypothetical protein